MRMLQRQQQAQVGLVGVLEKGRPDGNGSCVVSTSAVKGQSALHLLDFVHCLAWGVLLTGTLAELLNICFPETTVPDVLGCSSCRQPRPSFSHSTGHHRAAS